MPTECPFCNMIDMRDRIIFENDLVFAMPTNIPIVPGHILVCPKRHVQYYEGLTEEEKKAIEHVRNMIKDALRTVFNAEGFNYAWNEEKIGGQSVPHFHLHILPRKEGDAGIYTYEPREFLYRPGPRSVASPAEELSAVAVLVRNSITPHETI